MFRIDSVTKQIHVTRGDIGAIDVTATDIDGNDYTFIFGDIVRLNIFEKKNPKNVLLSKEIFVDVETNLVTIQLSSRDTRFWTPVSKPTDFWYEIELNPRTYTRTLVCYDEEGPKLFTIYPEGVVENEQ